jgi:hypothetical protein
MVSSACEMKVLKIDSTRLAVEKAISSGMYINHTSSENRSSEQTTDVMERVFAKRDMLKNASSLVRHHSKTL